MSKKMTKTQQFFVCNLIAQYKTNADIVALMKQVHKLTIPSSLVSWYAENHKDIIEKLRGKFLSDITSVPIAQKKIRLQRAEELYQVATKEETPKSIANAVKILEHAQSEIEGRGANINMSFNQFNQYNTLTDEELLKKKKELENKIINMKAEVV